MLCTVLNASHEPLSIVSARRGLILHLKGRVHLLEVREDQAMRSEHGEFPVPVRVILKEYLPIGGRYWRRAPLSNEMLFMRDEHTCQYCGRTPQELRRGERLTRDHVMPRSRGGLDRWDNVVTACSGCNHRKADRTPSEADMVLRKTPKQPRVADTMRLREARLQRQLTGALGDTA